MTKYRFLFSLLLLLGLAASCSKDDFSESQNAEDNRVVLTVNASDVQGTVLKSAPQLRSASGDLQLAGYSLRYILEVWNGSSAVAYREEKLVNDASQTVTFDFSLSVAGNYDALLWADYIADDATLASGHYTDKYYTTNAATGLKAVSIIGSNYAVNTPSRDAFFGKTGFTKVNGTPLAVGSVTLVRPFGRINIIEKDAAVPALLTSMDVSYVVPSGFNVLTGAVSGTYSVAINGINSFPNAATEKANLFFDYILAPSTGQQLLGEITIGYTLTGTGTFIIPANMPVERNKRTNISGNMIANTSATTISVELDDTWSSPDNNFSTTATVGSYLYEGGLFSETYNSSRTCLGVVFEVNAAGTHGKIISLDQSNKTWYGLTNSTLGLSSRTDGAANTAIIKAKNDRNDYLAFAWIFNKGNGWYMPAIEELFAFKAAWDTDFNGLNSKLTAAGGTAINNQNYWSSTEATMPHTAWSMAYSLGIQAEDNKANGNPVRAMMAF